MSIEVALFWMQEALKNIVLLSGPILIGALIIGLAIAVFQAVTSIQEMTLSYVPKMLVVVIIIFLLFGFMLETAVTFMEQIFSFIGSIGD